MILLPQRVVLECHIKLLWQTINSLEMPQSLQCIPLQTHTLLFTQSCIKLERPIWSTFFLPLPSIILSAAFLVYWLFSWHALFLPLACQLFSNIVFLPVIPEVTLSSSSLVIGVFSLVEILRLFLLLFPSFPFFLPLHWPVYPSPISVWEGNP